MPNRLAHATSPYLLQHAGNPVDWYPWGPEAFAAAFARAMKAGTMALLDLVVDPDQITPALRLTD